jgi:hypothetical protein
MFEGDLMSQKSVPELIYDKFAESVGQDALFKDISDDLVIQIRAKKKSERDISNLLSKVKDEDSRT